MKCMIFLDDERNVQDVTWIHYPNYEDIIVVRNAKDFKEEVSGYVLAKFFSDIEVDIEISFDHDIQCLDEDGKEVTGYDLLKWMVDYCFEWDYAIPECYFHTQNPIGKKNMESYYLNALINCK